MKLSASVIAFALCASQAQAHSWVDCWDWDQSTQTCNGYSRDWNLRKAEPFGADVGRDIRPGADVPAGLFCDRQKEPYKNPPSLSYTDKYPMTRAGAGQELTLRWPAKNHATVGTQRGVQIFLSRAPGAGDDFTHITSKDAWLQKYPQLTATFSNCNPNRANVDRAICSGTFALPRDLASGVYTIMWWWEFNAGEFYNSCADIEITSIEDGGVPPTRAPTTSAPTITPGQPTSSPTYPPLEENCALDGEVIIRNEWNNGFIGEIKVTATSQVSQWGVDVKFANGEKITNIWNCKIGSESNGLFALQNPEGYLSTLSPGQSVTCGFQASKPDGNAAYGGQGAFVRVKGCADTLELPKGQGGDGGNGGDNGDNNENSAECNNKGALNMVKPNEGICMQTCDCVAGYFGKTCETTNPEPFWEVKLTKRQNANLDFLSCDLQVSYSDLLKLALSITNPNTPVEIEVRDVSQQELSFRVYDKGAISTFDVGNMELEFEFETTRVTPTMPESNGSSSAGAVVGGLFGAGVIVAGAVYLTRRNNEHSHVSTNSLSLAPTKRGHDVMAPHASKSKLNRFV